MKTTPIYKIVTKDLKSCCSVYQYWLPEMTIQYKINEWISPSLPNTGIMVFTDLEKIREFIRAQRKEITDHWIIFKGEGVNVRPKARIVLINKRIVLEKILSVWRAIGAWGWKKRPFGKYGFYAADMVKLTDFVADAKEMVV